MSSFFTKLKDKFLSLFKKKAVYVNGKKLSKKTGIANENGAASLIYKIVVFTILVFYSLLIVYLLYWAFINSIKSFEQFSFDAMGLPSKDKITNFYMNNPNNPYGWIVLDERLASHAAALNFGNYKMTLKYLSVNKTIGYFSIWSSQPLVATTGGDADLWKLTLNTLYNAGVCSGTQVIVSYTTAYITAKYRFKFSNFVYMWAIIIMGIPIIGSTASMVDFLQDFGLYSNYLGLLLMRTSYAGMYYLVFYAFFEGLPDSYIEAAEVDGASQLSTYIRVVLPLGIKTLLTVTLIQFVGSWNDYSTSFIYMPTIPTLAYSIYELAHSGKSDPLFTAATVHKMAGCLTLISPLLLLFIVAKDKLMGNVSAGGLKG